MVTNDRLQELIEESKNGEFMHKEHKETRYLSRIAHERKVIYQELLTLRHEMQLLIEDSERLAYLVNKYVSRDLIGQVVAMKRHHALMKQVKGVAWCGGVFSEVKGGEHDTE